MEYDTVEHPEAFTIDALLPHMLPRLGKDCYVCKNLFLWDKKKKEKKLYLVSALHHRDIRLNALAKQLGVKELRFADERVLEERLSVKAGCVTAYALLWDAEEKAVQFVVDKAIIEAGSKKAYFHPMVNSASTGISGHDLKRFLALTNHDDYKTLTFE